MEAEYRDIFFDFITTLQWNSSAFHVLVYVRDPRQKILKLQQCFSHVLCVNVYKRYTWLVAYCPNYQTIHYAQSTYPEYKHQESFHAEASRATELHIRAREF